MRKLVLYLIGSLRNPDIPQIGNAIREQGIEVFDDWFAAGPIADDSWQEYSKTVGQTYKEALNGWAANHIFSFDKTHLDRADMAVLALPAGKSAHLEFGYMMGKGKPGWVLFPEEPERWDVMYQFATDVFFNLDELVETLRSVGGRHRKEMTLDNEEVDNE